MKFARLLATCVCLLWFGCGSSDGDAAGSCTLEACGGAVLGSWKMRAACYVILVQPKLGFCPKATAELHVDELDGTLIFDKDTYSNRFNLDARMTLHLPSSCKQDQGEALECSDFDGVTDGGLRLKCSAAANGDCACESPFPVKFDESGVYTVRGKQLEWRSGTSDFCVTGSQLVVRPSTSVSMGEMGDINFLLQTTFDKQ